VALKREQSDMRAESWIVEAGEISIARQWLCKHRCTHNNKVTVGNVILYEVHAEVR
jgi:hypothetical protein